MSNNIPSRRISIRSVRKNPPDLSKLGRALIQLAAAKAEAEACSNHEADRPQHQTSDSSGSKTDQGGEK